MLSQKVGEILPAEAETLGRPPRLLLDAAAWKFVNLECVVSDQGRGRNRRSRYPVRAHCGSRRPEVLGSAQGGLMPSALANDHANDFGTEALLDSITRLSQSDIAVVGAGQTPELAYAPHFFSTRDGQTGALMALTDFENDRDGQPWRRPRIATRWRMPSRKRGSRQLHSLPDALGR